MCGLTAIFNSQNAGPIDEALLQAMTDRLAHRGPDGSDRHIGPGIGLGHRRLSIIDVEGGHQPMYVEDGQVVIVFNGEIYNFQEITRELKSEGVTFKTRSDTEVILRAWVHWGAEAVSRLQGMFAFVLWDGRDDTFFMARDRLGKKPLYYTQRPDGHVLVGSELKALREDPSFDRTIDPQAVEDFFAFGYVPEPKCIFSSVKKLPAAHWLKWRRGAEPELCHYWHIPRDETDIAPEVSRQTLKELLSDAVKGRLISDVPLGAFLSGGVDSSAIVATMSELGTEPVKTFSIGFGHKDFDERAYAQKIADLYHTDHHVREVDPDDFSLIQHLGDIFDEPFGDASALPTYRVCEAARQEVTVCLSGDGGDEVFGGYRRHRFHLTQERLKSKLPQALRKALFGTLAKLYPKADWAPRFLRAKTTFAELAMSEEEAYFNSVSAMSDEDRGRIFSERFKEQLEDYQALDHIRGHFAAAPTGDPLRRAQYVDLKTWLPGDILVKADRTSMAVSLELRAPFLDYRMAEFGMRLPAQTKIAEGQGKMVLKKAMEDKLPGDILYRPKQGFSVPLADWFRGPLREEMEKTLNGDRLAATGYFDMAALEKMAREHGTGLRDHSRAIWLIFVFDVFLQGLEES
ncbi:MAG: amidotransferase 1, exosortase A system-associated [Alphaproteobacteria bacterium]|nr:MAG: amidotransferase 1, exosortase A system-associated [Alphaproteobacteria bacterium]